MSMSSQWAKRAAMASWLASSAAAKVPSVASEKTTPKPKVSSGRLRSMTVTSWRASAFFIRIARYRPAGPPPTLTIRIKTSAAQASMAEAMASEPALASHPMRRIVRIAPGRPALMLGLRVALATVVPLLSARFIGQPAAVWASTGGFIVALADKGGSYRTRARIMGGLTLTAACAVVAAAFAAPYAWAAAPLMLVIAGVCAFAGALGPAAAAAGVTAAVLFAVSLSSPPPSTLAALERGVAVAGAGVWAMTLALLFWPVRVYKPARWAVARTYRALAAHARKMAELLPTMGGEAWMAEVTRGHGAIRDML